MPSGHLAILQRIYEFLVPRSDPNGVTTLARMRQIFGETYRSMEAWLRFRTLIPGFQGLSIGHSIEKLDTNKYLVYGK